MYVVNISSRFLCSFHLLIAFAALSATAQETNLPPIIGFGESWRYWNHEMAPAPGWKSLEYNDSIWTLGAAQLGYGDGDEATVTRINPPPHPATAYFRKLFSVGSPTQFARAQLRLLRDDGAVVYINGVEVVRDGMPPGELGHNTLAAVSAGEDENAPRTHLVNISNLLTHTNVIAVEVHQVAPSSTDMSFDLELRLTELPIEERAIVSVLATQPNTSEPLPNALVVPGEFTVFRADPHWDQPLNVYLTYSGTAGSADYEPLPIAVFFPAGSNAVKIPVLPKTDGLVEGSESVIARFAAMPVEIHDPTSPNRPYMQNFSNYVAEVTIQDADKTNQLPPIIELLEPRNGEVYAFGAPIVLSANAASPVGFLSDVWFYAGTNWLGMSHLEIGSPSNHVLVWTNAPTGSHILYAVVMGNLGKPVARSEFVFIKVGPVNDRPSIAIEAVNNLTSELNGAADAGKFRVRRVSGPTDEPVLFSMQISGQAVNGIDYEAVPSVATIPSGAESVELFVRGLGDDLREGLETAEFRLNEPGCGTGSFLGCYSIFGEGAVQIHIMDGPLTTNYPPNAIITFPAQNSLYNENQVVEFRAEGVDIEGQVVQMDLLWGDVVFATTNGPVIVGRTNFPPGEYSIRARARDNTGKVGWSLAVRIFVETASSIRIDQPPNGAVIQVGQPIQISATAIDLNGYIPRLEFFANDLSIGVSEPHFLVAPPPGTPIQHSIVWSNAPIGDYAVTAFGTDSRSRYISSPQIYLTVTNAPGPSPVVGVFFRPFDYPVFSGFETTTGMFEFYRMGGATNEALQIFFDKGGTATPGEDYVSFNNYIVFAPGRSRTNILVNALDDQLLEGVETVVVELKPAPPGIDSPFPTYYVINPTNQSATVAIMDDEATNTEPRIEITRPGNGSNFRIGMPISIEAFAIDPAGYVPRVEFYAGTNRIGISQIAFLVPPPPGTRIFHSIVWSNAPAGQHSIVARGFSNRGFDLYSTPIQITVGGIDRIVISVQAIDPHLSETGTNGVPDQAYFRIRRVSGAVGAVTVGFTFTGSATYGSDYYPVPVYLTLASNDFSELVTIVPISDAMPEGDETVVLTLMTNGCGSTLGSSLPPPDCYDVAPDMGSAEIIIHDSAPNQPPRVTITAPHDGAVFEQGERVHYRVEASDPDSRVLQISMLMDGRVILSTNTGAPFVMTHSTNPPVGEHTFVAIARDGNGATNVSQRVRILVRGTNDFAFFERQLPAGFTPGTPFTVRIQARVPSGTQAWGVEDLPPPGWSVSSISDGGIFDPATGKVKFGHFLEPGTRTLSYVVRPSINGGTNQFVAAFSGIGSIDGRNYPILGQSTVSSLASEFHPADRNEDRRIALAEVTGYAAAWKLGETWPVAPNPIPASYVTRAGLIWRQGEAYRFAATNPPPFCWVPLAGREGVFLAASTSAATRSISGGKEVSSPRIVTLEVEPAASVTAYNVEERVPEGWTVQNITGDGVLDPVRGVVRWGLYLDSEDRTLSYQLVPPEGVAAGGQLLGEVTLDGEVLTFAGADSVVSVDPATQLRLQSTELTDDGGVKLKLGGAASQICVLESSSDLVNWSFMAELFLPNGELEFRDSDVGETQRRYYRLRAR